MMEVFRLLPELTEIECTFTRYISTSMLEIVIVYHWVFVPLGYSNTILRLEGGNKVLLLPNTVHQVEIPSICIPLLHPGQS
jgi:hypothetical protein